VLRAVGRTRAPTPRHRISVDFGKVFGVNTRATLRTTFAGAAAMPLAGEQLRPEEIVGSAV